MLKLTSDVDELTVYVKESHTGDWYWDILHEWVLSDNAPKNLNVTLDDYYPMRLMLSLFGDWVQWNADMPASRTACLRFYSYETRYLP